jgi:beta-lactamase class A
MPYSTGSRRWQTVNEKKKRKLITINATMLSMLLLSAFALGIFIGSGTSLFRGDTHKSADGEQAALREGGFTFINPLIECESNPDLAASKELKPFRSRINTVVERALGAGAAENVSVYFRDLNNGHSFGINETDKFSPESLLKIPVMIAYFKRAESNPLSLKRKLAFTGPEDWARNQTIKPLRSIARDKSYTIDNLIFRMLAYDDMNAFQVLHANLPAEQLKKVFADLSVDYDPAVQDNALSLKDYAAFLRVLYNASYLNRELSEKALKHLSNSVYREGIIAGTPPGVEIASKFGERTVQVKDEERERDVKQLHDFGIVYFPKHPYLLGIMTRGKDFKEMGKVIRDISHEVYDEVYRQSL